MFKATPKKLSILSSIKNESHYDDDFFKWTKDQAKHLKNGNFSQLDIKNLIEEMHSLGRSEKRALQSYFEILFGAQSGYYSARLIAAQETTLDEKIFPCGHLGH